MQESAPVHEGNTKTAGRLAPAARRAVWAGAAGNVIEWYDFTIYGYLAVTVAAVFFPSHDPVAGLLSTFAVFAVAYVARPLGAFLLGIVGDRRGRRTALSLAILVEGLSTAAIGLIPSYRTIGIVAPALLVVARLAQGISVGGEAGGASAFVVEHAPRRRRGWVAGMLQTSTAAGMFLGAAVAALCTAVFGTDSLATWGWRVPFLLALPLCLVGLYLRVRVEESPHFDRLARDEAVTNAPVRTVGRRHRASMLTGGGVVIGWLFAAGIVLIYMPTWLSDVRPLTNTQSLVFTFLGLLCYVGFFPVTGWLSDRFGRRPVMLVALLGLAVSAFPAFLALHRAPFAVAFLSYLLLLWFIALFGGAVPAILSELFPTRVRTSGVAITYALTVAVFQGPAPLLATYLQKVSGYVLIPAVCIIVFCLPSIVVALKSEETSRVELT